MGKMNEADKAILNEAYRNCKIAVDAIHNVLSKVGDEDLSLDLNKHAAKYRKYMNLSEKQLRLNGEKPEEDGIVTKAKQWAGMQASTLLNTSTSHIANLMIQGNTRGITDMMKVLHKNKSAQQKYCEMANELMDFEQEVIEQLKYYYNH